MSRQIIVKTLSGFHLGMRITVTTANTTTTGVLQGFTHDSDHITIKELGGQTQYELGRTESRIQLLPGQTILCELTDKVIVHGRVTEPDKPRGWEYQDTEQHCGCAEAQEMAGPSMYASGNAQPAPVHMCDNRNAAHQAEMNGEAGATRDPRTVIVAHKLPSKDPSRNEGFLRYGQAITGYPIRQATIMEEPRNHLDREWLSTYLPAYIAPGGQIVHEYEKETDGPVD